MPELFFFPKKKRHKENTSLEGKMSWAMGENKNEWIRQRNNTEVPVV